MNELNPSFLEYMVAAVDSVKGNVVQGITYFSENLEVFAIATMPLAVAAGAAAVYIEEKYFEKPRRQARARKVEKLKAAAEETIRGIYDSIPEETRPDVHLLITEVAKVSRSDPSYLRTEGIVDRITGNDIATRPPHDSQTP